MRWGYLLRNRYRRHRSVDAAHNRPSVFGWRKSVRRHLRERPGRVAHRLSFPYRQPARGIVLGTGDLSELALGWSTYGVGDQMSHYNVNAGVPKTLIQHLIRWVISAGEFGEKVGEVLQSVLDTEITPNSFRPARRSCRAARPRSDLSPYRTFRFFRYCATDFARRRLRFWPGMRGTMRSGATGRPASQRANARPIHWPKSGIGCRFSSSGFIRLASSSVRHCPTAPRCPTGRVVAAWGLAGPVGYVSANLARSDRP